MASKKLTVGDKTVIIRKLLGHSFLADLESLIERKADHGMRLYKDVYSTQERDQLYAVPPGWMPTADYIRVGVGGTDYNRIRAIHGDGNDMTVWDITTLVGPRTKEHREKLEVELRVPYKDLNKVCKIYEATHPLMEESDLLNGEAADLMKKVREAKVQAEAVIAPCSTLGALLKTWPEVEPFTRDIPRSEPDRAVPVVVLDAVNSMFKLPVAEEA